MVASGTKQCIDLYTFVHILESGCFIVSLIAEILLNYLMLNLGISVPILYRWISDSVLNEMV